MNRIVFAAALVATVALSSVDLACSHSHDEAETKVAGLEDVVYVGGTTDEALNALLGAPTKTTKMVSIASPMAGTSVPANATSGFAVAWGAVTMHRRFPNPFGVKLAHAHGAAVNGSAYLLVFKRGEATVLRVFTSSTSYTPDAAAWAKLGTGSVSVTLTAAVFDNNAIAKDGGPYVSPPIAFTVTP